jgi:transposase
MAKRKRRVFSSEYKTEVVELVRKSGRSIGAVAKQLDLTETAVRRWVEQAEVDQGRGSPGVLTTVERDELSQLRRRVKQLEMEREILKNGRALRAPARRETPGESTIACQEEWPSSFWCSANP